jgi:hypothetical protein
MRRVLLLILYFEVCLSANAQNTFQKIFGESTSATAQSIQQTLDGGFIIGGESGIGNYDYCLIKTDIDGNISWNKSYDSGADEDRCYCVQQTTDDGYILSGIAFYYNPFFHTYHYVIKTNTSGDISWSKFYKVSLETDGYLIRQTSDGGYILIGDTYDTTNFTSDISLVKIDSVGNIVWSKAYGGIDYDEAVSVQQQSDNGYIVAGNYSTSFGQEAILFKVDSVGSLLWKQSYSFPGNFTFNNLKQGSNKDFLMIGTYQPNGINFSMGVIRTDSAGNVLWSKTYGGGIRDHATSGDETVDKGFIISGYTASFADTMGDIYLVRIDSIGNVLWSKTFGGQYEDYSWSVLQTSDSGFILTGWTNGLGMTGVSDVYIVKTDSMGNSGCNEFSVITNSASLQVTVGNPILNIYTPNTQVINPTTSISIQGTELSLCSSVGINNYGNQKSQALNIFPNPANTFITITSVYKIYSMSIFNLLGEKEDVEQSAIDKNEFRVGIDNFIPGVYFIKVETENGTSVQKLMKQ